MAEKLVKENESIFKASQRLVNNIKGALKNYFIFPFAILAITIDC